MLTYFANHVGLPTGKYSALVKKETVRLDLLFKRLGCKMKNKFKISKERLILKKNYCRAGAVETY